MLQILYKFTFLGPYIGSIAYLVISNTLITFRLANNDSAIFIFEKLAGNFLAPFLAILAYPYAIINTGIPQMIIGVIYWKVLKCLNKNPKPIKRILIGGSIGFIFSLIYYFYFPVSTLLPHKSNGIIDRETWFIAIIGAIASAFCALLISNKIYSNYVNKT